jgi:hypothetical protein
MITKKAFLPLCSCTICRDHRGDDDVIIFPLVQLTPKNDFLIIELDLLKNYVWKFFYCVDDDH